MDGGSAIVLRLEVASDREPVTGLVRAPDGTPHEFTGWSELFAVLAKMLPGQAPRPARAGR